MKRQRRIRPSFIIVTVGAATAIGGACSSSTITTNPPGIASDAAADTGSTVVCPATAPMTGDPCTGSGSCTIDAGTNACGFQTGPTLECVDGKWLVMYSGGGCNPGAPVDAGSDAAVTDASDGAADDGGDAGD